MKFILVSIALLFCFSSRSQVVISGGTLAGAVIGTTNATPPSSGWTLISHTGVKASGSASTLTTPTFSTVGANLVVFIVAWSGGSSTVGSDSASDTVNASATYTAANPKVQCFYVISPTQTASYTVTAAAGGNQIDSIHAYAFNKSSGAPAFDAEAAGSRNNNWQTATIAGGSVTPATSADLIFTGVAWDLQSTVTTTATVDSGFTASPDGNFVNQFGMNSAYKIKSDGTAENPGWTGTPTADSDVDTSHWWFK